MAEDLKFNATLDPAAFAAGMAKVESIGKAAAGSINSSFTTAFTNLAGPIAAIGPAIAAAFAGGAIVSGVKKVFDTAEALGDLADQTGVSVGRLAVLGKAFENAGLAAEDAGGAINRMQKFLQSQTDEAGNKSNALERLHLSATALKGLRPEQQLIAIGQAVSSIQNPAERTVAAMDIFGKSGGRLQAVFTDPAFLQAGGPLTGKAAILERNAEMFAQASIKLQKVGGILKSFYTGVADRIVTTLLPTLERLEKINLIGIGQQFGDGIAKGAQMFLGAFSHPELVASALENGLAAGVLGMGNVLVATLKTGGEFFKDGMLDSLQGIGSAIVATLMESFDKPIRYLQAGIEAALQTAQYMADKASGKQDDTSGLGGMSPAERKEYYEKQQSVMRNRFRQLAHDQLVDPDNMSGREAAGVAGVAVNDPMYKNAQAEYERARHYDPSRYARTPQTMQEIMAARAKDPTRFGLYGGGQTAAEWRDRAKEQGSAGWQGAMNAVRGFHVDDVFGASEYGQKAAAGGNRLAALGRRMLGPVPTAAAATGGGGGPVTSPIAIGRLGIAIGQNAIAPYSTGLAMDRYNAAFNASHRMGQTGLDSDPSSRPGWTGAKNAQEGFRQGLSGGAYGRTGNIFSHHSGRTGKSGDPAADTAKHTAAMSGKMDKLLAVWSGGSGSGGSGGGATATK